MRSSPQRAVPVLRAFWLVLHVAKLRRCCYKTPRPKTSRFAKRFSWTRPSWADDYPHVVGRLLLPAIEGQQVAVVRYFIENFPVIEGRHPRDAALHADNHEIIELVGDATGKYPRNELDGLLASPHAHLYKPAIAWLQKERPDLIAPVAHADVM